MRKLACRVSKERPDTVHTYIYTCTDNLIGIESLVSETYLAGKKNYNLGIKKYKKVYNFRVYWGRDFEQYTLIALAPPHYNVTCVLCLQ